MNSIINLLLGAISGAILSHIFPIWIKSITERFYKREINKRKQYFSNGKIYDWLIKYYTINGRINDLYNCKIGNYEIKIPFLTKSEWQFNMEINEKNIFIQYAESDKKNFEIDYKLIRFREKLGQYLFNDPILYLDRIENGNDDAPFVFHVKECTYFEMFTPLGRLEEETYKAIQKNNYKFLPIRDKYFASVDITKNVLLKTNIGCSAVFAVKTESSYEIILATRSYSTATFGGSKSTIPTFGLVPFSSNCSEANILFYNFIKEYCEELFSYDDLIKSLHRRRIDPLWFYDILEAAEFMKIYNENKVFMEATGFGFDALNGSALVSMLVIIDDMEFAAKLKKKIKANWEMANEIEEEPVEFIDFKSDKLEQFLKNKKYHYGSAFALSKALEKLEQIQ